MKNLKITLIVVIILVFLFIAVFSYKKWRAFIIATAAPTQPPAAATSTQNYGYTTHTFRNAQGLTLTYELYMPLHYNPMQKYPLVLLLHGGGERSSPKNTAAQNLHLLLRKTYVQVWSNDYTAAYNPEIQQHWPCFVVVPQISQSQVWVNTSVQGGSYQQSPQPTPQLLLTKELLVTLQHQYRSIDANRLYILGLSLGGYGVWDAIERWPDYFAAAVPIAGAGDPSKASALTHIPLWAFHGSDDNVVPVAGSRAMIAAIKNAGGDPRYTEFAGKSHEIWDYVFSSSGTSMHVPNFFSWLFAQHK